MKNDDAYNIIDKIDLYGKDENEAIYQYLIKSMRKLVLKSMKIQKILLNIQVTCRMHIRILKSTT